jgi:hypothetical protein
MGPNRGFHIAIYREVKVDSQSSELFGIVQRMDA